MSNRENRKFSIIIPVQEINDYILETCQNLKNLNGDCFEVFIFPDEIEESKKEELEKKLKAKIFATGNIGPAGKRDMALKYAQGEFLAFLDDDAYPKADWLGVAEKYLENLEVAAIGGPQLTPNSDSFWQKVSGAVFLSPLSGNVSLRYWPGRKAKEVDDWPTVNFIIRKSIFSELGGFASQYWPGEDTKLCLAITRELKKKIMYIPSLIVFHHRRTGLKKHLKQVGSYGLHRGFFAKKFPETSRKLIYFLPSLLDIFIIFGAVASFFSKEVFVPYIFGLAIYSGALLFSFVLTWNRTKDLLVSLITLPFLVLTHLWYGARFIQGFVFTGELKSQLGK
jgi:cellulose synthase/poly-beta-1,6-N-acetylglucosamine synthase-like glycosyltransferase